MSEDTGLETILEAPATVVSTTLTESVEPVREEPAIAETGVTSTAPPADAPAREDDGPLVPRKALEDERRKRQDYEKRLQELEQRLTAPQQQQQPRQPPQPPPNVWEDPDGWAASLQGQMEVQLYETRLALGTEMMRQQKPDYDDVITVYAQYVQSDPQAAQRLMRHPNPAAYAYKEGKRLRFLMDVGDDPDTYLEKQRQAWAAEHQPHQAQAQQSQQSRPSTPAPKSLAGTTSAQPRAPNGQFASGPASLSDILGG